VAGGTEEVVGDGCGLWRASVSAEQGAGLSVAVWKGGLPERCSGQGEGGGGARRCAESSSVDVGSRSGSGESVRTGQ